MLLPGLELTELWWTGLVGPLTVAPDDASIGQLHLSYVTLWEHEHGGKALLLH